MGSGDVVPMPIKDQLPTLDLIAMVIKTLETAAVLSALGLPLVLSPRQLKQWIFFLISL